MRSDFQKGQITTEYTVTLVFLFILAGFFMGDPSLIQQITDGISTFYANYSYAITAP